MPKGYPREPGLKKIPVPCYRDEIVPNLRDARPEGGPLEHVPREGVSHVHDYGAQKDETRLGASTGSPASATFLAGNPTLKRDFTAQKRELQETQYPTSLKAPK